MHNLVLMSKIVAVTSIGHFSNPHCGFRCTVLYCTRIVLVLYCTHGHYVLTNWGKKARTYGRVHAWVPRIHTSIKVNSTISFYYSFAPHYIFHPIPADNHKTRKKEDERKLSSYSWVSVKNLTIQRPVYTIDFVSQSTWYHPLYCI